MIISGQILNPIFVCYVSIIYFGQEVDFFSMIKGYVALGFILNIDDLFGEIYPKSLKAYPEIINDSETLKMPVDKNSNKRVLKRCWRRKNICKPSMWVETLVNLLINLWVWLLTNFVILFFNYFAPFSAALLQIVVYTIKERERLEKLSKGEEVVKEIDYYFQIGKKK